MHTPIRRIIDGAEATKRLEELRRRYAIKEEHRRLEVELDRYAFDLGYSQPWDGWAANTRPDVLKSNSDNPHMIFVGDAKDAKNETSGRTLTAEEIIGYFQTLVKLFNDNVVLSALVVIGTNDSEAAEEWSEFLNNLVEDLQFVTINGDPVRFEAVQTGSSTWMISPE